MKKSLSSATLRFIALSCLIFSMLHIVPTNVNAQKTRVIFDTDMGPDYDDVGALAILHVMADNKEVNILGTFSSNRHEKALPCISVINTWFGRPTLPMTGPNEEGVYLTTWHKKKWTEELPAKYPHYSFKDENEMPDMVEAYRYILSKQPKQSVTIVTVGFTTNIAALLRSKADRYSSLSGVELVRDKVKLWVAMAGAFPSGKEFNVEQDATSSRYAIENFPSPILFSGFEIGAPVLTGKRLISKPGMTGPVYDAYSLCLAEGDKDGRSSWDQTAVLVAVKGIAPYFDQEKGKIKVATDGSNTWEADPSGPHSRLLPKMPVEELATVIEDLMMTPPKRKK